MAFAEVFERAGYRVAVSGRREQVERMPETADRPAVVAEPVVGVAEAVPHVGCTLPVADRPQPVKRLFAKSIAALYWPSRARAHQRT